MIIEHYLIVIREALVLTLNENGLMVEMVEWCSQYNPSQQYGKVENVKMGRAVVIVENDHRREPEL